MQLRNWFGQAALPLVRILPHRRVSLSYPKDRRISFRFYPDSEFGLWLGFNEPRVLDWWMERVGEETVVYDVGAHIGIYSLLAAVRGATVHAFEPAPDGFQRLQEHVAANGFTDRIESNECVVSEQTDAATLHLSTDGRKHSLQAESGGDETRDVQSTTIDTYRERTVSPDVVKVDVEGAGHRVLDGASATIEAEQSTWLIELHNQDERDALRDHFDGPAYEQHWLDDRHVVIDPIE